MEQKSIKELEEIGTGEAFYELGEMYFYGKGVETNYLKAKLYYEKALDENYDDTYYKLGLFNSGDYGFPKDEEKSNEYFKKIEKDFLLSIIYLLLATRPTEEQNLAGIYERLGYSREYFNALIEVLENINRDNPAVVYYKRLRCLKHDEYTDIVKRLKIKVEKCLNDQPEFINDLLYNVENEEFVRFCSDIIINSNETRTIEKYLEELENNESAILSYIFGYLMIKDNDIEQGLTKLINAKDKGNIFALYSLANIYYKGAKDKKGTIIEKNYIKSLNYIEEALNTFKENFENKSIFKDLKKLLGKIYYYGGYGVEKDLEKAIEIFEELAENNEIYAIDKLIEYNWNYTKDYEKIYNLCNRVLKEKRTLEAVEKLGALYYFGYYVDRNMKKARELFEEIQEKDDWGFVSYSLGHMYFLGEEIEINHNKSYEYFKKSAELGYDLGEYMLGYSYLHGYGTNVEEEKAMYWLKKAAEKGYEKAKLELEKMQSKK